MKTRQIIGILCLVLGVIGFLCNKSPTNPGSSVETYSFLYNSVTVILWIWLATSLFTKILMVADKKIKLVSMLSTIFFGIVIALIIIESRINPSTDMKWSVIQHIIVFVWMFSWVVIDAKDAIVELK